MHVCGLQDFTEEDAFPPFQCSDMEILPTKLHDNAETDNVRINICMSEKKQNTVGWLHQPMYRLYVYVSK